MIEWDGIQHKEKTKRGFHIMRLSKNGNIRIIYNPAAIQGKYSIEWKTKDGYWDRGYAARYSNDFIAMVEKQIQYAADEPLDR